MDEALHHLFVRRHVGIQKLEDQPLVDDLVLHQQYGTESALADFLDELVAAVDDIARLEGRNVEYRRRLCRCLRRRRRIGGRRGLRRVGFLELLLVRGDKLLELLVFQQHGLRVRADFLGAEILFHDV